MMKKKIITLLAAAVLAVSFAPLAANAAIDPISENSITQEADNTALKSEVQLSKSTNCISPVITVTNTTDADINLKDAEIKFYYSADDNYAQMASCDCSYTQPTFTVLTQNTTVTAEKTGLNDLTASDCLKVNFTDGTLKAGESMTIYTRVHYTNWMSYDLTNDANTVEAYLK